MFQHWADKTCVDLVPCIWFCSFCRVLLTIFSVRVPFDLTFASCCFQHRLLSSSSPKYGWCSTGVSKVPAILYRYLITLRLRVIWRTWHFVILKAIFQRFDHRWSEVRSPCKAQPSASVLTGWYSKASSAKRRIDLSLYVICDIISIRQEQQGPEYCSLWDTREHSGFLWHRTIDHYPLRSLR